MSNQLTDDQLQEALATARVPKKYRDRTVSLANYGAQGDVLKQWVDSPTLRRDIMNGQSQFLVTKNTRGMDIFYTLARSMVVRGVGVRVISLPTLLEAIENSYEGGGSYGGIQVLFLGGFYVDSYDKPPMTDEQRFKVEWKLSNRIRDGNMIVFQATAGVSGCKWYSRWFLQLVADTVGSEIIL